MTVARQMDVRSNIKTYFDIANEGNPVFVPRKNNKNVYIISQSEYEACMKAKRNNEYLTMLDHSLSQLESGEVVHMSLEDLRAYE